MIRTSNNVAIDVGIIIRNNAVIKASKLKGIKGRPAVIDLKSEGKASM